MPFGQNITFMNDKPELRALTTTLFCDEVITVQRTPADCGASLCVI